MSRSPWQAGALLLALTGCVAPPAQSPAETPVAAAPAPVVIVQPPAPQPVVSETESEIVIESIIAALPPPEAPAPATPQPESAPPMPQPEPATATPQPASEPATAAPQPEPATAAPQPAPEPAPEPEIDDDPEQLMGLAGGALAALLGEPGFRRADADAQVWQYRGLDCLLDVYLYRDGEDTPHRVTYYEFRGDGGGRPCLRDLLRAQAG